MGNCQNSNQPMTTNAHLELIRLSCKFNNNMNNLNINVIICAQKDSIASLITDISSKKHEDMNLQNLG